jgi:hypothetical protein
MDMAGFVGGDRAALLPLTGRSVPSAGARWEGLLEVRRGHPGPRYRDQRPEGQVFGRLSRRASAARDYGST